MRDKFIEGIRSNQQLFGLELTDVAMERLACYFQVLQEHNRILHLVAPCSPGEFATRHILESLTLLKHLSNNASIVDLGSGGGLPAIPCLLVREDLKAQLIESKQNKARFLEVAVDQLKIGDRASVINRQFQEVEPGRAEFVTCRAIEKFTEILPKILKWSAPRPFLFFGGPSLAERLDELCIQYSKTLMPLSQQRYLIESKR